MAPGDISLSSILAPHTGKVFVLRESELQLLDDVCTDSNINIFLLHAPGGTGKTALLQEWLKRCLSKKWDGFEFKKVFGWSFYNQGSRGEPQVSAEPFISAALRFFHNSALNSDSPQEKAKCLTDLLQKHKTLLILDGLEPLQQAAPLPGKVRDAGLWTLLAELVGNNPGLLVISSRLKIPQLENWPGMVQQHSLEFFTPTDGAALLQALGVQGPKQELKKAATEFGGHGLALVLLATWLKILHNRDIRNRQKVTLLEAAEMEYFGSHAQRMMRSYEYFFGEDSPELAFLRVLSLFDRPVTREDVDVVLAEPIRGVTEVLAGLTPGRWAITVQKLIDTQLLQKILISSMESPHTQSQAEAFDTHPLVREYFALSFRTTHLQAWQEAHRRLYEFYKKIAEPYPKTFEEMQLLYAAVTHGCLAGLYQSALDDVFQQRIWRGQEAFSWRRVDLFDSDLAALTGFFELPWTKPAATLSESSKGLILNNTAFCLYAQGHLHEAVKPMGVGENMFVTQKNWKDAAISASNLGEILATMGELKQAVSAVQRSVKWADQSGDAFECISARSMLADTLYLSGELQKARALFAEAEAIQKVREPEYPHLYSLPGYRYCNCMLAEVEYDTDNIPSRDVIRMVRQVNERAEYMFRKHSSLDLLNISLYHLTVARALVLEARLGNITDTAAINTHFEQATQGFRDVGREDHLSRSLIHRAAWYHQQGFLGKAEEDLETALQIAGLSEMRLHRADAYLGLVALGGAKAQRHWEIARNLIAACGYGVRRGRLAALKRILETEKA